MPKKEGRQALWAIDSDPELKNTPVAVWTTSEEIEDKIYREEVGVDAYVTKPSEYKELVGSVKTLLARYVSTDMPRLRR
jgi:DNA-binding response OmpR family regulator